MAKEKKYCTNHPGKESAGICHHCRRQFCSDCLCYFPTRLVILSGGYCRANRCQNVFRDKIVEVCVSQMLHYGASKESTLKSVKSIGLDDGTVSDLMASIDRTAKLRPKVYSVQKKLDAHDAEDTITHDLLSEGESRETTQEILAAAKGRISQEQIEKKLQEQLDKQESCEHMVHQLVNDGVEQVAAVDTVLRITDDKIKDLREQQNSLVSFIFLGIVGGVCLFCFGMANKKLLALSLCGVVGVGFGIKNIIGSIALGLRIRELEDSILKVTRMEIKP